MQTAAGGRVARGGDRILCPPELLGARPLKPAPSLPISSAAAITHMKEGANIDDWGQVGEGGDDAVDVWRQRGCAEPRSVDTGRRERHGPEAGVVGPEQLPSNALPGRLPWALMGRLAPS